MLPSMECKGHLLIRSDFRFSRIHTKRCNFSASHVPYPSIRLGQCFELFATFCWNSDILAAWTKWNKVEDFHNWNDTESHEQAQNCSKTGCHSNELKKFDNRNRNWNALLNFIIDFLTQKVREPDKLFSLLTSECWFAIVSVYHGNISDFNVEFLQKWWSLEYFRRGKCRIVGDGKATAHTMITFECQVSLELNLTINIFDATSIGIAANWYVWIGPRLIVHYTFTTGEIAFRFTFTLTILLREK